MVLYLSEIVANATATTFTTQNMLVEQACFHLIEFTGFAPRISVAEFVGLAFEYRLISHIDNDFKKSLFECSI